MTAEASISAVRVPGLSKTMTTSKWTAPSGETKLTRFTFSTRPVKVFITAGIDTSTLWPAQISPS